MVGDVVHEVPGELVSLLDQAAEMIAGDTVEHPSPVPVRTKNRTIRFRCTTPEAGVDQSDHP